MQVFVTGGTGFIGGHLSRALLARGHRIRMLVHRRDIHVDTGVECVTADITDPESLAPLVAGCDALINLVGIIREFPGKNVTFQRLHEATATALTVAARMGGVRRFLQMSALGTRPQAVSRYHRSKFQAEETIRASGLDFTIFRPSLVFGPKDAFVNMLAGYIRSSPAVPVIGDGTYRLQPISADDVARCFAQALEMPETVGKTYELGGAERFTYNEMLDIIGRVLGKERVRKIHAPLAVMRMVVPLMEGFALFPLTMDQIQMLVEENICGSEWQETFRFEPVGFEAGIVAYLAGKPV
jgi:NADH dehydrogenase